MKSIKHGIQKRQKEWGQGFVEYALILMLVALAVVLVVTLMQPAIGDVFSRFVAQAPVAPPSLLNYTPPPSLTPTATIDPSASATPIPSSTTAPTQTPIPSDTPIPSNTPIPSDTPTHTHTPTLPPCGYGPQTVNGSVRVQMEDFRCGGVGVSFSDQSGNGPGSGAYRTDYGIEGPDLENTSDGGGGYNLGWTQDGEWLEYTIITTAPVSQGYAFIFRYAAPNGTNPQIRIRTTWGGLEANTPVFTLPPTGGTQTWQNYIVPQPVTLFAGINTVRITIVNDSANFNYFDIQPFVATPTPTPVTPTATTVPTSTPVPTNTPQPVTVTFNSNASHNGSVLENSSNSSTGGSVNTTMYAGDANNNSQYISIVSFNTSSIPANATITGVTLRLQQSGMNGNPFGDGGLGVLYADIGTLNGFSGNYALQVTDFQAPAAATNVISLTETNGNNEWSTGNLGSGNFSRINRNSFTQFKIHFEFPDDGDGSRDRFRFASPQLVVTYTVP